TVTTVTYKGANLLGVSAATPKNNFSFTIFPNPVSELLFLDFNMLHEGNAEIVVTDVKGNIVTEMTKNIESGNQRFILNLPSNLEAGTHQVKVSAEKECV